nr:hypothetical protein [Tanacetum cinerariifolium]
MLIVVPFHNLKIGDSNDPPLGVYIECRFSVNSEPVELLMFLPPVRNSPKGLEAPPQRYSMSLLMKCANEITRRPRLPPDDIQALPGCYMTPSSIHMLVQPELETSCFNHDTVLEVSSAGKTIQDAEKFE